MNIINDPLQLVILFVLPQVDNLIISFSNLPKKVGGVIFSKRNCPIPQLFGISISIFT
jgi:hypothetical protein